MKRRKKEKGEKKDFESGCQQTCEWATVQ